MPIEITVRDTETGETRTETLTDGFRIVVAGRHYISSRQEFPGSGTHQLTIKVDKSGDAK